MKISYSSNNSGGYWWLTDKNWKDLEKNGWEVQWIKDDPWYKGKKRFLNALATSATKNNVKSLIKAIREWEEITGNVTSADINKPIIHNLDFRADFPHSFAINLSDPEKKLAAPNRRSAGSPNRTGLSPDGSPVAADAKNQTAKWARNIGPSALRENPPIS